MNLKSQELSFELGKSGWILRNANAKFLLRLWKNYFFKITPSFWTTWTSKINLPFKQGITCEFTFYFGQVGQERLPFLSNWVDRRSYTLFQTGQTIEFTLTFKWVSRGRLPYLSTLRFKMARQAKLSFLLNEFGWLRLPFLLNGMYRKVYLSFQMG